MLGATTAYLEVMLRSYDATANESAGGTIWFDNAQVWNAAALGNNQTSMPYCELVSPQAPVQWLLSGLLGDLPAPAYVALGVYLASWPTSSVLNVALGRGAQSSATARLVGNSTGFNLAGGGVTSLLDPASYGGWYVATAPGSGGWNPRAFSPLASDQPGVYHLLARLLTQETGGNVGSVEVRVDTMQRQTAWYGQGGDVTSLADLLGSYYGPFSFPFTQGNTWTVVDAGQAQLPPFAGGALSDPTQTYLTPRPQIADLASNSVLAQASWQLLLPVDGSLVLGVVNNPSNGPFTVAGQWLWNYVDGLLVNRAAQGGGGDGPAWTLSVEASSVPNPAHAGGGPGTQGTGSINANSGADPYLTLDPTASQVLPNGGGPNTPGAVNVLAGYISDGTASGNVGAIAGEVRYSPLYLYPR